MWSGFLAHPWSWSLGVFLGVAWLSRLLAAALGMHKIAEITRPEYNVVPVDPSGGVPRVSIIVPARNEAEHIETALLSLLELDYPDYEVIAVDDRSDDATGAILDRLQSAWRERGEALHHRLKVLHIRELP
jgi:cellulose synthase/poly-beta-1,6-N-acetylglucosamine synthase-like glycosyltransferase